MKHKNIVNGLFLGILFLFSAAGLLLPATGFSESENRYLAGKPGFSIEKLVDGSFGRAYETYLSDQFPLRDQFVAAKTNIERLLFKEDVNGVYFGKDGYYIERFDSEILFTEQLTKNLDYLAAAAEQYAGYLGEERVKIMLVPSASQILSDKLPPFASPADQSRVTELLKNKLHTPSMVLPVEQELKKHEKEELYYRTDHHWTTRGAYISYRLYCEAAGFVPWEEEHFLKETVTSDFLGTVESKVRVSMRPDEIVLYEPAEPQEYKVSYDQLPKEYNTLYNRKALEGKDKYSVFLDGNHGWTKILNETIKKKSEKKEGLGKDMAASKERRLLIIKDSYAHSFAPFMANHFGEVHMVDLRYFNMKLSEFMEAQEITDVLVLYQIPGFSKEQNLFKMPLSLDGMSVLS